MGKNFVVLASSFLQSVGQLGHSVERMIIVNDSAEGHRFLALRLRSENDGAERVAEDVVNQSGLLEFLIPKLMMMAGDFANN
jgi:hypothetical protein